MVTEDDSTLGGGHTQQVHIMCHRNVHLKPVIPSTSVTPTNLIKKSNNKAFQTPRATVTYQSNTPLWSMWISLPLKIRELNIKTFSKIRKHEEQTGRSPQWDTRCRGWCPWTGRGRWLASEASDRAGQRTPRARLRTGTLACPPRGCYTRSLPLRSVTGQFKLCR